MRQRVRTTLPDQATIERREQVDVNEVGEPIYDTVTIAEDTPCRFDGQSTSFVREESGERVSRPATVTFGHDTDLKEGDTVTIAGQSTSYEVRGIDATRDHRRGVTVSITAELERVD